MAPSTVTCRGALPGHLQEHHQTGGYVTDRIYVVMAGLTLTGIIADVFLNDSDISLFLIRKLFHLVDYLEFWR